MEINRLVIDNYADSYRDRVTGNLVLGANPISMNTSGFAETNREYKILVRKADFEGAQYIISNQLNK